MLADDFQFSGPIPEPINKETWLEMGASLKTALRDLDYHFKVIGVKGDVVRSISAVKRHPQWCNDLTKMILGVIHATNKAFSATSSKSNRDGQGRHDHLMDH